MTRFFTQLNLFLIALTFFTRIPMPSNIQFSQENLNLASRYFSAVGWVVGIICALTYVFFSQIFVAQIAILFSMLISVLLTGCFHEDGLADTCDGLGGAFEKQKKLKIMKDSRLGTYGATGLWFALTFKFLLLVQVESVVIAFLVAHPLSRAASSTLIYFMPYVSEEMTAKSKPLTEKMRSEDLIINLIIGLAALLLISEFIINIVIFLSIFIVIFRLYLMRQIGGFTGDTLGASQQITELMIYAVIASGGVS